MEEWLEARVVEASRIQRGCSQAALLKVFTADAGDQPSPYRYHLKSCKLIQAQFSFGYLGTHEPGRNNEDITGPCVIAITQLHVVEPTRPYPLTENEKWLLAMVKDCASIEPGMSRARLLQSFYPDGGLQATLPTRYIFKKCQVMKIDVTFDGAGKTAPKRPISSDAEMAIETVSTPYLQFPAND